MVVFWIIFSFNFLAVNGFPLPYQFRFSLNARKSPVAFLDRKQRTVDLHVVKATPFTKDGKSNGSPLSPQLNFRRSVVEEVEDVASFPVLGDKSIYDVSDQMNDGIVETNKLTDSPEMIEFVETNDPVIFEERGPLMTLAQVESPSGSFYPFATMMQGSGVYIAAHAGNIAVFHIPGELIENQVTSDHLLSDMALCWLLGMKVVIVVGGRHETDTSCPISSVDGVEAMLHPHECHNSLRRIDSQTLRAIEEESGFLRTEIERKLNRCLRAHGASSSSPGSPSLEGNVVSGKFYTAQQFGVVRGQNLEYTGYANVVNNEKINQVLNNNDVVLLSTVGMTRSGELVSVNGYHLAALVASSLKASKVIYVASEDSAVLRKKGEMITIQELPLSFAKSFTEYHQVRCHNNGLATFEKARKSLSPGSVEMLVHLGWASWAMDRDVQRAHIVNPSDGALLEELFTSKNGANTCLYHDDDGISDEVGKIENNDWADYFEYAGNQ